MEISTALEHVYGFLELRLVEVDLREVLMSREVVGVDPEHRLAGLQRLVVVIHTVEYDRRRSLS